MTTNIILTNHAKARMRQNQLNPDSLLTLWQRAKEVSLPEPLVFGKFMKYGVDMLRTVKYYRSSSYLFTVGVSNPHRPVLITVTKMK